MLFMEVVEASREVIRKPAAADTRWRYSVTPFAHLSTTVAEFGIRTPARVFSSVVRLKSLAVILIWRPAERGGTGAAGGGTLGGRPVKSTPNGPSSGGGAGGGPTWGANSWRAGTAAASGGPASAATGTPVNRSGVDTIMVVFR